MTEKTQARSPKHPDPIRQTIRTPGPIGHHPGDRAGTGQSRRAAAVVRRDRSGDAAPSSARRRSRRWKTARPSIPMRAASCHCARRSAISTSAPPAPTSPSSASRFPARAMLAVVTALQMVCETGDNVVIVSPDLAQYFPGREGGGRRTPSGAAGRGLERAGRWQLDLDKLFDACDARTKAMFIASPGNPTGWMLTGERTEDRSWISAARAASPSSATRSMAR